MNRYLLILGAGIYQLPIIKKARERNIKTIVASPKGNFPGIKYADKYWEVDLRNSNKILNYCKEEELYGVITSGSDICMPTLGKVVDSFGLIGPSFIASRNTTNKIFMKTIFKKNKIPTSQFIVIENYEEANIAAQKIGYPVMIKAADSSGSRGITKVNNKNKLFSAWKSAKKITNQKKIIVEKFIDGKEYGAEVFIQNKKVISIVVHNKTSTNYPISTPIGHSLPSNLNQRLSIEISEILTKAIKILDLDNTVCNVDFIISGDQIFVVEIAARIGGTCIPEVISHNTGVDVYDYLIDLSLGIKPNFIPTKNIPNASILLRSKKDGLVKSIQEYEKFKNDSRVLDFKLDFSNDYYVRKFRYGQDRIGHIIVQEKNTREAEKLVAEMASHIKFIFKK